MVESGQSRIRCGVDGRDAASLKMGWQDDE